MNKRRMEILFLEALMFNLCLLPIAFLINKNLCKGLYLYYIINWGLREQKWVFFFTDPVEKQANNTFCPIGVSELNPIGVSI